MFDLTAADRAVVATRLIQESGPAQTSLMWESLIGSDGLTTVTGSPGAMARVVEGDTIHMVYLRINTSRVTDVDVRKAINYAYDKQAEIDIMGGASATQPATTITAPTVPGYRQYDLYPAPATGDVAKAKALLTGKTLPPLRYCYRPGSPVREQSAAAAKAGLERAGFQIELDPIGSSTRTSVARSQFADCDLVRVTWGQDYPSNRTVVRLLLAHSELSIVEDPLPFADLGVPVELNRLAHEPNLPLAAAGYAALDERVMRDLVPLVPVLHVRWFSLVGSRIGGAHMSPTWGRVSLQDVHVIR